MLVDAIVKNGGASGSAPWIALGAVAAIFLVQRVAFPFLDPAMESLEHRLTILVQQRVMTPLLRPVTIGHLEDAEIADELRLAQQVGSENFSAQQALGALTDLVSTRLACHRGRRHPLHLALVGPARPPRRLAPLPALVPGPDGHARRLHGARHPAAAEGGVRRRAHPRRHGRQGVPHLRPRPLAASTGSRPNGSTACATSGPAAARAGSARSSPAARSSPPTSSSSAPWSGRRWPGEFTLGEVFIYLMMAHGHGRLRVQPRDGVRPPHGRRAHAPRGRPSKRQVERRGEQLHPRRPPPRSAPRPRRSASRASPSPTHAPTDPSSTASTSRSRPGSRWPSSGENGAGKTTLVNLLCGFYQPTGGRITVDGVDLAEIDKRAWQRRIAAVFQEFAKYPLTLRENVVLGHPGRAADYETRMRAGQRAGIMELVESLPANWNTVLSKKFEGGTDLSGGQWQRVALARAMFALECGAGVLAARRADRQPRRAGRGGALRPVPRTHRRADHHRRLAPLLDRAPGRQDRRPRRRPHRRDRQPRRAHGPRRPLRPDVRPPGPVLLRGARHAARQALPPGARPSRPRWSRPGRACRAEEDRKAGQGSGGPRQDHRQQGRPSRLPSSSPQPPASPQPRPRKPSRWL